MSSVNITPGIVRFGPCRAIGLSFKIGKERPDFGAFWDQLMKRHGEIGATDDGRYFGLCRCIPGATDGTWEYVPAAESSAKVPQGMVEVNIPECEYASIEVQGLEKVKDAWGAVHRGAAKLPGYETWCGEKGCECATHPSFEYYPADFPQTQRLYLYVPLKRV